MSLPESSRSYEGQLLCYVPRYGWGWSRLDLPSDEAQVDYAEVDRAGPFHIRVHRFFEFRGRLRGLVGRVEQADHLFEAMWVATWVMHEGEFDLTENLCCRWDIELGPTEPTGDDWPEIRGVSPVYLGYGTLAVSADAVTSHEERELSESGGATPPSPAP